jgi:hypothetical protein
MFISNSVYGQTIYAVGNDDNGQQYMYKINLTTCTFCAVTQRIGLFGRAEWAGDT